LFFEQSLEHLELSRIYIYIKLLDIVRAYAEPVGLDQAYSERAFTMKP